MRGKHRSKAEQLASGAADAADAGWNFLGGALNYAVSEVSGALTFAKGDKLGRVTQLTETPHVLAELTNSLTTSDEIKSIDLSAVGSVSSAVAILQAISHNSSVAVLCLNGPRPFRHTLPCIACSKQQLAEAVTQMLLTNRTVTRLVITGWCINDHGVSSIAAALTQSAVDVLDLSSNQIQIDGTRALREAACSGVSLTTVGLAHNPVSTVASSKNAQRNMLDGLEARLQWNMIIQLGCDAHPMVWSQITTIGLEANVAAVQMYQKHMVQEVWVRLRLRRGLGVDIVDRIVGHCYALDGGSWPWLCNLMVHRSSKRLGTRWREALIRKLQSKRGKYFVIEA